MRGEGRNERGDADLRLFHVPPSTYKSVPQFHSSPSPSSLQETETPADELIYFVYFALTVMPYFTLFCLLFSHDASHLKSINPPARSLLLPSAFFFIFKNNEQLSRFI